MMMTRNFIAITVTLSFFNIDDFVNHTRELMINKEQKLRNTLFLPIKSPTDFNDTKPIVSLRHGAIHSQLIPKSTEINT